MKLTKSKLQQIIKEEYVKEASRWHVGDDFDAYNEKIDPLMKYLMEMYKKMYPTKGDWSGSERDEYIEERIFRLAEQVLLAGMTMREAKREMRKI